ncbi:MAG: hypothetical protein U0223_11300 [Nitrospira sp.]
MPGENAPIGRGCAQVRRFKATLHSKHALPVADNRVPKRLPPRDRTRYGSRTSPTVRPANEARLAGAELLEHVWNA